MKFKNIYFSDKKKLFSFDLALLKETEIHIEGETKKLNSYAPFFLTTEDSIKVISFQQRKFNPIAKFLFGKGYYYKRVNYTFDFIGDAIVLKEKLALNEEARIRDLK